MIFDKNITWSEANFYCKMLGGHLATANDESEYLFLQNFIKNGNRNWYYIGGQKKNNVWEWIDNSQFKNIEWSVNAENFAGCNLMMYKSNGQSVGLPNAYNPEWDIVHIGFICEIEGISFTSKPTETDVYTIHSEITNLNQSAIYYVASYTSNGRLIEINSKPVNSEDTECELSLSKNKDIAYIKAFLWDLNLKPLTGANILPISE